MLTITYDYFENCVLLQTITIIDYVKINKYAKLNPNSSYKHLY